MRSGIISEIVDGLYESRIQEATKSITKITDKQRKAAQIALKKLIFNKFDEANISSDQFKYVGVSNEKMAEILSEIDPKYDYEVLSGTDTGSTGMKFTKYVMSRIRK